MQKAFIFDMDGVLVDSEPSWKRFERPFLGQLLGKNILEKLKLPPGGGIDGVRDAAIALGAKFDDAEFRRGYDVVAAHVYDASHITAGLDSLGDALALYNYKIGIVTNSPRTWIDRVLPRLPFKDKIAEVVSLKERPDLKRKPDPDGYIEALKLLGADTAQTIVLEDSNVGIAAGKAAGAYVIGYRGNLLDGYEQEGADAYADTMADVAALVEQFDARV